MRLMVLAALEVCRVLKSSTRLAAVMAEETES
jgi:hypothetical protein